MFWLPAVWGAIVPVDWELTTTEAADADNVIRAEHAA
jgi:hypothetical protein